MLLAPERLFNYNVTEYLYQSEQKPPDNIKSTYEDEIYQKIYQHYLKGNPSINFLVVGDKNFNFGEFKRIRIDDFMDPNETQKYDFNRFACITKGGSEIEFRKIFDTECIEYQLELKWKEYLTQQQKTATESKVGHTI